MCINKHLSSITQQVYESILLDTDAEKSFSASNVET